MARRKKVVNIDVLDKDAKTKVLKCKSVRKRTANKKEKIAVKNALKDELSHFENRLTDVAKQMNMFLKVNKRFLRDCNFAFKAYSTIATEYAEIKNKMLVEQRKCEKISSFAKQALKRDRFLMQTIFQAIKIIDYKNKIINDLRLNGMGQKISKSNSFSNSVDKYKNETNNLANNAII